MEAPFLSLVIPCYNEANRIDLLMQGLDEFKQQWDTTFEILLVDDGSTDQTMQILQQHNSYEHLAPYITILTQRNTGKGGALRHGVAKANGDYILTLDADMATKPTELIQWRTKRKSFYPREILIGSRELNNSQVHDLGYRKFVGNIFNFIIRNMVGLRISDTQCGFKLYPKEAAKQLFAKLQTMGWAHDVELLKRANLLGYAIIEMPITWNAIEGSKINVLSDSWNMFWEVVKIRGMKTH
jgi:dolichyl-phosphate beta-glucosyltransferase